MNTKLLFVLGALVLLSMLPMISALSANITVESDFPLRSLVIRINSPGGGTLENLYPGKSNLYGNLNLIYETSLPKLDFEVLVVENGEVLETAQFEDQITSEPIKLDLKEREDAKINASNESGMNETETLEQNLNSTSTLEEETASNDSVTGQAIISNLTDSGVSKMFYYILAIVVLGGIVGFVVGQMIRARKIKMGFADPVSSKSEVKAQNKVESSEDVLADAERKLKEAQTELDKLRSRDKIRQAEERLNRDRDELEKLRSGK